MPEIIRDHFTLCGNTLSERDNNVVRTRLHNAKAQGKAFHGELFEKLDDGYGNPILKHVNSNTVVIGGAILALQKLTGVTPSFMPPALNDRYNIIATPSANSNPIISLFGCGIGGSGLDFTNVKDTDIKACDIIDGMVPLRHAPSLTGDDASKYYFKKSNADGTYDWYLKEFDTGTTIKTLWKNAVDSEADGSEVTSDISGSTSTDGIETFAEFGISLNTLDVREYFEAQGNLSLARYNSFGFYTGEKVGNEYANVRLFSYVNFKNRDVSVKTKSSFLYRIYSLI